MSFLLRAPGSRLPAMLVRSQAFRFSEQSVRTLSSVTSGDVFGRRNFSVNQRGRYATEFLLARPEPVRVHLSFRIGPEISGCGLHARYLHNSGPTGEKASSKIEETVNRWLINMFDYLSLYKVLLSLSCSGKIGFSEFYLSRLFRSGWLWLDGNNICFGKQPQHLG